MARTKGSPDVAPKVRFIIGKAIEKIGVAECVDMLVEEIKAEQSLAPIVKYQGFFPKEVIADIAVDDQRADMNQFQEESARELFRLKRDGIPSSPEVH